MSLNKYNHSEVENRIYAYWERNNLFKPKKNKKKYCIVDNSEDSTKTESIIFDKFMQFLNGFQLYVIYIIYIKIKGCVFI